MKRGNLLINLGLVFSILFCAAFACNNGDEKSGGMDAGNPPSSSSSSEKGAPDERTVKETFIKQFGDPKVTFESIEIKPTQTAYTSNLGVYVHGFPVKISSTTLGGYGVKNGTRTSGVYYFYTDEFGEWHIFQGDSITRTDF